MCLVLKNITHAILLLTSLLVRVALSVVVLHCPNTELPATIDGQVNEHRSLTSICTDQQAGVGIRCRGVGGVEHFVLGRHRNIHRGHEWQNILLACFQCECVDVAPDVPDRVEATPAREPTDALSFSLESTPQPTTPNSVNAGSSTFTYGQWDDLCSDYWYGRPKMEHCVKVLEQIEQLVEDAPEEIDLDSDLDNMIATTWFYGTYGSEAPSNFAPDRRTRLPKRFRYGTCSVSIYFSNPRDSEGFNWGLIYSEVYGIVNSCVKHHQVGGSAQYPGSKITQAVYGPNSKQGEFENLQIALELDSLGNAYAHSSGSDPNPPSKKQKTISDAGSSNMGTTDKNCQVADSRQCNKPCYSHDDCDLGKDYVCAFKGDVDIPIDVSWGQFQCIWVAGAAVVVQAALQHNFCKTGRCLLDADGTLLIPNAASDITEVAVNNSQQYNTSTPGDLRQTPNGLSLSNLTRGRESDGNVTYPPVSSTSSDMEFDYTLYCPCNCTYVSRSCCTSTLVTEEIILKVNVTSNPSNVSLQCDHDTGKWVGAGNLTNSTYLINDENHSIEYGPQQSSPSTSQSSDGIRLLGSGTVEPYRMTITSTQSAIPTPSHSAHVCGGECSEAIRVCDWGWTGECKCGAPKLGIGAIFFWFKWPCVSRHPIPTPASDDLDKRQTNPDTYNVANGSLPVLDPTRTPGVCNNSYISYACANTTDGLVHEPPENWLGALLPSDADFYPPIPGNFLSIHGIKSQPNFGRVRGVT